MKRLMYCLLILIFVLGFTVANSFGRETTGKPQFWPRHISWSSPSGSKWITAVGFTGLIQKYTGISSSALGPTGGGVADLRNLKANKAEIAWGSNPSVRDGWLGIGYSKSEGPQKWIRCLSGGYLAYWYILASNKSGIVNFRDIRGHRWSGDVMVGSDVTDQVREGLLKIYGMTKTDYKGIPVTKFSEVVAMLKEGRADVGSFFGGIPSPQALELVTSMDIAWISMGSEEASRVAEVMPGHEPGVIPAGKYKGQEKGVVFVSHMTIPVVSAELHQEVVYEIMKSLFDHPEEMEAIHPSIKDFARKSTSSQVTVPYHDGAIKYYKEKGLWTSNLETHQRKLLSQ